MAREPSRLDPLQHDDEWEEQRVAALAAAAAADVAAAAQLAKRAASIPQVEATPKAMGAVWELVQCCVGAVPLRRDPSQPPLPRPPAVQWYDARARQALLLVASWLQVRGVGAYARNQAGCSRCTSVCSSKDPSPCHPSSLPLPALPQTPPRPTPPSPPLPPRPAQLTRR